MRLINGDDFIEKATKIFADDSMSATEKIGRIIIAATESPTIEAAPVVHGRWVDRYGGKYANPVYDCSECKRKALYKPETDELGTERFVQELSDVCPNCGVKMVEKEAI